MVGGRAWEALADSPRTERAARSLPWVWSRAERAGRPHGAGVGDEQAFATVRALAERGVPATVDRVERAGLVAPERARRLAAALGELPDGTWLALDLAAVGLGEGVTPCRRALARVLDALPVGAWLQVGAQDPALAGAALEVVLALAAESAPLVVTLPATLRRSAADARELAASEVAVRLVEGVPSPPAVALPWGRPTDLALARLAAQLRADGARVLLATRRPPLRRFLLATVAGLEVELPLAEAGDTPTPFPARVAVPTGPGWFRTWLRTLPT